MSARTIHVIIGLLGGSATVLGLAVILLSDAFILRRVSGRLDPRLEHVRDRLASVRTGTNALPGRLPANLLSARHPTDDAHIITIEGSIAALERMLIGEILLLSESTTPPTSEDGRAVPNPADLRWSVEFYQRVATSATASASTRIQAAAMLRRLPDASARSRDVVASLIDLLRSIVHHDDRRNLVHALGDLPDDRIVQPLMELMLHDRSRHVRESAAIELTIFRDLPPVATALRFSQRHDGAIGVRAAAERALQGRIYGINHRPGWR